MSGRNASPTEIRNIGLIAILMFVPVFALWSHFAHPFVNPHLPSKPYEWPEGCKPPSDESNKSKARLHRYYGIMDRIPRACMEQRYYFPEAEKYNFPQSRAAGFGGRNYYRLDRDAINFACDNDQVRFCTVIDIVEDVFVDSESQ